MRLLLTSAGLTNESIIQSLKKLAQNPLKKFKLTYIPTASNVVDDEKLWIIKNLLTLKDLIYLKLNKKYLFFIRYNLCSSFLPKPHR